MSKLYLILFSLLLSTTLGAKEVVVKDNSESVIVITDHIPPYSFINEQGQASGSSYIKVKELFNKANINFTVKSLPWKRAIKVYEEQNNLLIYPFARTRDREFKFHWILPVIKTELKLYGLRSKYKQMDADSLTLDLSKKELKFVCIEKTVLCAALLNFGVNEKSIIKMSNVNSGQILKMLIQNRVDFIIMSNEEIIHASSELNFDINNLVHIDPYTYEVTAYLAARKSAEKNIVDKLKAAANKIQ